jgi:hypothetical protein
MSPTDPPGKSDRTDQHTEVSSTATREALGKLGQWLDLDSETQLVHLVLHRFGSAWVGAAPRCSWPLCHDLQACRPASGPPYRQ